MIEILTLLERVGVIIVTQLHLQGIMTVNAARSFFLVDDGLRRTGIALAKLNIAGLVSVAHLTDKRLGRECTGRQCRRAKRDDKYIDQEKLSLVPRSVLLREMIAAAT